MKKVKIVCLYLSLLLIASCTSDDGVVIEPTTSLEITLKDKLGNTVRDAVVKLYSSENDWNNNTNQVGETKYSNAEGKVTFSDLSNIKYYWLAEKGCMNNIYGSVTTTSPIEKTKTSTVTSILEETGVLKLVSTSSNPYRVSLNGQAILDMPGGSTRTYILKTGAYTVNVKQLSGFVLFPTEKDYSITIGCGQTVNITYP